MHLPIRRTPTTHNDTNPNSDTNPNRDTTPTRQALTPQAALDARAAEAASLLETIRNQTAEWIGDHVDGFTLTKAGSLFGAWHYYNTYENVHTGNIRYVEDDLNDTQAEALRTNLHRFAQVAPDEHLSRSTHSGWILLHLAPYIPQD